MRDPRLEQYAELLVGTCVDVQPGWQVLVIGPPVAQPLLEEVGRSIARRGAYAVVQLSFSGGIGAAERYWVEEAPEELLAKPASLQAYLIEQADAIVAVNAPINTREESSVAPERLAAVSAAYRPATQKLLTGEIPWVGCQFPTPALAQEAGMSTDEFAEFLYGACLLDWDAERVRMQRYADLFDAAEEVRIVAEETDLRLSIAGRPMKVDAGNANIPGGEFFCCPVEDSAEGTIAFTEFPAVYAGRELTGVRLRFEGGRVVDASAEANEDFLIETLDRDEGARRVGELGIGCNPGITRYMRNTLFDEKIDGTAHIALGQGFPEFGGSNESSVHWDIVKDLRRGGRILLDGAAVQEERRWLLPAT